MRLTDFYATRKAKRHMRVKHQVEWEEVAQVMAQQPPVRRLGETEGERRYWLRGRTEGGRLLKIVMAVEGTHTARVMTAFEVRK